MQGGGHETKTDPPANLPAQFWEAGICENEYIKYNGVWKIKVFDYCIVNQAADELGWARSSRESLMVSAYRQTDPQDPRGPDELLPSPPRWPQSFLVPFHYPRPVSGNWLK